MKRKLLAICASIGALSVFIYGTHIAVGQYDEPPPVQAAEHDEPIKQPLPDYIRNTAPDLMASVTEDALYLGRAGIGEYWQYRNGEDTCVGLFFYDGEDNPIMNATCGNPDNPNDPGLFGTDIVAYDDKTVMQSAWFPGSWEDDQDYAHAMVTYREVNELPYSLEETPSSAQFERPVSFSLPDQQGTIERSMVSGDVLSLKTDQHIDAR